MHRVALFRKKVNPPLPPLPAITLPPSFISMIPLPLKRFRGSRGASPEVPPGR